MAFDRWAALPQLLGLVPDAVVAADSDGRIVFNNSAAEVLFGYGPGDLVGTPLAYLVGDPAAEAAWSAALGPLVQRHAPSAAMLQLIGRRKDGSTFPAEVAAKPCGEGDDTIVLTSIRDTTVREGIQALLRGLLEAAPDAVVCVLPDGTVTFVNSQAERLFGYRREELLGQSVLVLLPLDDRLAPPIYPPGYFEDPATRPVGESLHINARRKDGTSFPADVTLSSIETEGGILIAADVRDATERLESEARRRQEALGAQRQQFQRLESLGLLAGGVAHDFNNLLGVILNYASFVARRVQEDPVAVADIDAIRRAAERAAELTHHLLAFGRRDVVLREVFDVNDVLAETEDALRRTLGEHIDLATTPASSPAVLKADRAKIEQVLVNLVVNSRDALPSGGAVRIEVDEVEVDAIAAEQFLDIASGRYVRLRVVDTGAGMAAETLQRAFEPFFTTKPMGEGTGLGLAAVHGIVHQSGGTVELASEVGVGTTVTVYLPASQDELWVQAPQAHAPPAGGTETVLLVEDSSAVREMTRRMLADHGYTVVEATTPEEALEILDTMNEHVDLLLTDVVMPGMSGPELAEAARARRPGLPTLLMSGYAEPLFAVQGGIDVRIPLLEKPFTENSLLAKVRQLLATEQDGR